MIIKIKSFNKQSVHISDHKCISWAMHSSQYDASQNESELKVNYLKKLFQFSSLKWSDTDQMTMTFEKKIKILQEKFFSSFSQTNVNDITDLFIFLTMSFDLRISEDEVRQTIKRVKANKASDVLNILNRMLQTDLAKLTLILMSLFNAS